MFVKVFLRGEQDDRTLGKEEKCLEGFIGSSRSRQGQVKPWSCPAALATCTLGLPGQELKLTSPGSFFLQNN